MSIRLIPPPPPNNKRRSNKSQFALLELDSPTKTFEVHIEELSVGGAIIEFLGVPPPTRICGRCVNLFVDVGRDEQGERVAGTVRAEVIVLQPANKKGPARAQLIWAGGNPAASLIVGRLLTQQQVANWNSQTEKKVA